MSIRFKRHSTYLIYLFISAAALCGQTRDNGAGGSGSLRQHYNDAQELQRTGRLSEAAGQYRAFLAGALGELAMGYGLVQDYTHAAPLFDEALALEPDSPTLLLKLMRELLCNWAIFAHAKTLATEFIQRYPDNREQTSAQGSPSAWANIFEVESESGGKERAGNSRGLGSDLPERLRPGCGLVSISTTKSAPCRSSARWRSRSETLRKFTWHSAAPTATRTSNSGRYRNSGGPLKKPALAGARTICWERSCWRRTTRRARKPSLKKSCSSPRMIR